MSFFDDSHVTDVGLQGSLGPSVGFGEMVAQSYRQQFRVDSARALDEELRNRWLESLRAAQIGKNEAVDPFDPYAYRAFAQHTQGQPIDALDANRPLFGDYDPTARIKGMIDANEKIKQLNNPNIKTFEQILEEVSQMQRGVEEETASMSERSGGANWIASLIGAIGGSFTTRDPLNIITAPLGAGRTIATKVATEMALAAGITGYTELAEVAPARQIVGLPERNPLFNIAAATIGAGLIRGGIEGVGYGLGKLRPESIDFDFRDAQLAQMFEANSDKPSARAGAMILDDAKFIERNNPFGESRAAQERFIAELSEVQRAMNGEPMTAVGRVLPPLPYGYLQKAGDFEFVREQAPDVWAKMEAAQAKVQQLQSSEPKVLFIHGGSSFDKIDPREFGRGEPGNIRPLGNGLYGYAVRSDNIKELKLAIEHARHYADKYGRGEKAIQIYKADLETAQVRFNGPVDENFRGQPVPEEEQAWLNAYRAANELPRGPERTAAFERARTLKEAAKQVPLHFKAERLPGGLLEIAALDPSKLSLLQRFGLDASDEAIAGSFVSTKAGRKKANAEYQAAYHAVEVEAARLREARAKVEAAQQGEASNILAQAYGRPFIGPLLRHENVESLVERINKFNETLDEDTLARFRRETVGEGEDAIELEVWERDGGIDIGLRDPVDPNFTFVTDEGEMTVAAAMRDLQDDTDLVEAIRVCSI